MDKKSRKFEGRRPERAKEEFDQKIVDLARVTRVMAGGKRMRFRACVVIGDHQGRLGFGLAKGADVTLAVSKAVNQAKKKLIKVNSYLFAMLNRLRGCKCLRIKAKINISLTGENRQWMQPGRQGTAVRPGREVTENLSMGDRFFVANDRFCSGCEPGRDKNLSTVIYLRGEQERDNVSYRYI